MKRGPQFLLWPGLIAAISVSNILLCCGKQRDLSTRQLIQDREDLVEFRVREMGGATLHGYPFTAGIPLPMDPSITNTDHLSLRDAEGRELDAGIGGTVRWWGRGEEGSEDPLMFLDIDLLLDIEPGEERVFYLVEEKSNQEKSPLISVEETEEKVVLDNGLLRAEVSKDTFCSFSSLLYNGEEIVGESGAGGVTLHLPGGEELSTCREEDFSMDLSIHKIDMVSLTLKMDGVFRDPDFSDLVLTSYMTLFAGSPDVRFLITLRNRGAASHPGNYWTLGNSGSLFFEGLTLSIPMSKKMREATLLTGEGEYSTAQGETITIYQDSSGGENWRSENHMNWKREVKTSFRGYRVLKSGEVTGEGGRAEPILILKGDDLSAGGGIHRFWQNFPKGLGFDGERLIYHLFPVDFDDTYELQGGEQKTHEIYLTFSPGEDTLSERMRGLLTPPIPIFDPSFTRGTGIFGDFLPVQENVVEVYEETVKATIIPAGSNRRTFFSQREVIDEYSWRNFGCVMADHETDCGVAGYDIPISHYNNQYDYIYSALFNYMRGGDPLWFTLFDESARHTIDIDIYHTGGDTEVYNHGMFWHTTHDGNAWTSTHRTYPALSDSGGCTAYTSGGPGLGHLYSRGVLYHYLFTLYPPARDALLELADFARKRYELDCGSPACHDDREMANYIDTLLSAFILTGEKEYMEGIDGAVSGCSAEEREPSGTEFINALLATSIARYLEYLSLIGKEGSGEYLRGAEVLKGYGERILKNYRPEPGVWAFKFSDALYYTLLYCDLPPEEVDLFEEGALSAFEAGESYLQGTYITAKEQAILTGSGMGGLLLKARGSQ